MAQVDTLATLMVRHRAGKEVAYLVQDLHRELQEMTNRICKKVESKLQNFLLDLSHGLLNCRFSVMQFNIGFGAYGFKLES